MDQRRSKVFVPDSISSSPPFGGLLSRRAAIAIARLLWCSALMSLRAAEANASFPADPPEAATYKLPDPLIMQNGRKIATPDEWRRLRGPELLELFRREVYGRVPDTPYTTTFKLADEQHGVLGGIATRKDVDITIAARDKSLTFRLVLYTPEHASSRVPAFLLMGNAELKGYDPMRSQKNGYWPVEEGIARGYAMAAFWSWELDPDLKNDTEFKDGIHAVLDVKPRASDSWATLSGWAFGMSRCLDYLVTDPAIAGDKVGVVGHSRAGKTALWAAAQDERFALVCANDSGCGGAALSRRKNKDKETIAKINAAFPHWFDGNFKQYNGREDALPLDQHLLIALIAPRTVCVASADEDLWADPRGEFLSAAAARPAYALFGLDGLGRAPEMPPSGGTVHGQGIHYWLRPGKHLLTLSDWTFYFDSADQAYGRTRRPAGPR